MCYCYQSTNESGRLAQGYTTINPVVRDVYLQVVTVMFRRELWLEVVKISRYNLLVLG